MRYGVIEEMRQQNPDGGCLYLAGQGYVPRTAGQLVSYAVSERKTKHLVTLALSRALASHWPLAV